MYTFVLLICHVKIRNHLTIGRKVWAIYITPRSYCFY